MASSSTTGPREELTRMAPFFMSIISATPGLSAIEDHRLIGSICAPLLPIRPLVCPVKGQVRHTTSEDLNKVFRSARWNPRVSERDEPVRSTVWPSNRCQERVPASGLSVRLVYMIFIPKCDMCLATVVPLAFPLPPYIALCSLALNPNTAHPYDPEC